MVDVSAWMDLFLKQLEDIFSDRIWFVGLQGSYGRGEATVSSDIDVVVILDQLMPDDLHAYGRMLDTMPHRDLVCGFISGKEELLNWEPSDLFQFFHDTKPLYGSLEQLLPLLDGAAFDRAIKIGVCNIYHGCVHNMLHEKSEEMVKGLFKSASFVLQAIAFRQTGQYYSRQEDLFRVLLPNDREIANTHLQLKQGGAVDLDRMSVMLFAWAKHWIIQN